MKFLKRLKSSNFWVSMISAVVLILQAVFNVEIKTEYLNQIIMAILGLLVMSGIVSDSSSDEVTVNQSVDTDNITNMFTQLTNTFENNILSIVKQFETIKDGLTEKLTQTSTPEQANAVEDLNINNTENAQESTSTVIEDGIKQEVVASTVEVQSATVVTQATSTPKVSSENVL